MFPEQHTVKIKMTKKEWVEETELQAQLERELSGNYPEDGDDNEAEVTLPEDN